MGMCGFYRLPGEPTKEEPEKKPKAKQEPADKKVTCPQSLSLRKKQSSL